MCEAMAGFIGLSGLVVLAVSGVIRRDAERVMRDVDRMIEADKRRHVEFWAEFWAEFYESMRPHLEAGCRATPAPASREGRNG